MSIRRRRISRRARKAAAPVQAPAVLDLISESEVCAMLGGISKHTLYRNIAAGKWPRGVLIGPNTRRYLKSEYVQIVHDLLAARAA